MVICSISVTLLYSYIVMLSRYTKRNQYYVFMIEVMQVQELLAHSEIINVSFDSLEIMYNNEIYTIEQDENRLVKRVGYQILMHDIDEIQFWFEDEVLLMHVVYQEEEYEFGIYKKEWWRD